MVYLLFHLWFWHGERVETFLSFFLSFLIRASLVVTIKKTCHLMSIYYTARHRVDAFILVPLILTTSL